MDKNNVYYKGYIIEDADPETFKTLPGHGDYSMDKNNVYFEGKIITEADVKSFKYVNGFYYGDDLHVYKNGKIVPDLTCEDVEDF